MWTPGTPVTITTTNVAQALTTTVGLVKALRIYQSPNNSHNIYAGDSTLDPTTSPPTGIAGWAPPPPATGSVPYIDAYETNSMNGINANAVKVAGNAGEYILWSYIVQ